ncbi:MAG: hypothetical protein ABI875_04415 [Gemmatimonadales bacterium]
MTSCAFLRRAALVTPADLVLECTLRDAVPRFFFFEDAAFDVFAGDLPVRRFPAIVSSRVLV